MKKAILSMVALCTLGLAVTSAHAATFGSPAVPHSQLDGAYQITFIDPAHTAPIAGNITSWEMYAAGTGDVTLQIWRPIVGGYQLIGANPVTASSLGVLDFPIAPADQISVLPGDLLGFRYNQTGLGDKVIPFERDSGGTIYTAWPRTDTDVPVGGVLTDSQFFVELPTRTYSLAATVSAVPEPGSVVVLLVVGAMVARRRRA